MGDRGCSSLASTPTTGTQVSFRTSLSRLTPVATVHGAFLSGLREATNVANSLDPLHLIL
jgi:hypothetical protein